MNAQDVKALAELCVTIGEIKGEMESLRASNESLQRQCAEQQKTIGRLTAKVAQYELGGPRIGSNEIIGCQTIAWSK